MAAYASTPGDYVITILGTMSITDPASPPRETATAPLTDLFRNQAGESEVRVRCYRPSIATEIVAAVTGQGAVVVAGAAAVTAAASAVGGSTLTGSALSSGAVIGMVNTLQVMGMSARLMPDFMTPQAKEAALVCRQEPHSSARCCR